MKREPRKHLYEGMYIISATLSDDARKKAVDRIQNGLKERGGEVKKEFQMGRRRLSYQIDQHRDGYYYLFYFELPADQISQIWREYHLNEDLVRFLTLRVETIPEAITFKPLREEQ